MTFPKGRLIALIFYARSVDMFSMTAPSLAAKQGVISRAGTKLKCNLQCLDSAMQKLEEAS